MGNVKLLRTRALRDEAKPVRKAAAAEPAPARERILHAAEQLFAEHGMSGVGLRAISAAAEVNLASIAYHFGSKDGIGRNTSTVASA